MDLPEVVVVVPEVTDTILIRGTLPVVGICTGWMVAVPAEGLTNCCCLLGDMVWTWTGIAVDVVDPDTTPDCGNCQKNKEKSIYNQESKVNLLRWILCYHCPVHLVQQFWQYSPTEYLLVICGLSKSLSSVANSFISAAKYSDWIQYVFICSFNFGLT